MDSKGSIKEIDRTNKVFHVEVLLNEVWFILSTSYWVCVYALKEVMDHLVLTRLPLDFTVEHLPSTVLQSWYHSVEDLYMPELLLNQCVQRSPECWQMATQLKLFSYK